MRVGEAMVSGVLVAKNTSAGSCAARRVELTAKWLKARMRSG
ncbi:hypothetical protein [Corallococcus exiguus]|nr:hypothetical protein [Corallococcus exiguus]